MTDDELREALLKKVCREYDTANRAWQEAMVWSITLAFMACILIPFVYLADKFNW